MDTFYMQGENTFKTYLLQHIYDLILPVPLTGHSLFFTVVNSLRIHECIVIFVLTAETHCAFKSRCVNRHST